MKPLQMIRVMIPVLGICMLIGSAIFAIEICSFIYHAKSTIGTITTSEQRTTDEKQTQYRPTFTFEVAGHRHTTTSTAFVSPSPGGVGDQVRILYDERNPLRARIDTFAYTWAVPSILFCLAMIFGFAHVTVSWILRKNMPQREESR
ncbi:DUF3592 domain-containing protein [Rubripirellula reticaptiva]|uniref:DUF3592 domain-containing protein n=1 Tax=Rubripirellula reticaptiva TaxID=2528013 RepID=A0A5C6FA76_9BACT|nr:DUF3592 domain-containing protein [Rubripirellula reticaptiva]TWU58288.1 hypothetical protein Poly59_11990 [Rubripirellula reticaptiva]